MKPFKVGLKNKPHLPSSGEKGVFLIISKKRKFDTGAFTKANNWQELDNMGKWEKLLNRILRGNSDGNVDFEDLRAILYKMGFAERIKGSHHIFYKKGVVEIINIQAKKNKAKAYQVKQVRQMIVKNQLEISNNEK